MSSRIRGATSELEEMGEGYEDVAEGFSKYRDEIKALTNVDGAGGFDIMLDADSGTYKDIYDIFVGISQVWDQMSDTTQSRVAEILGGTRQLQIVASIIQNISDAEGAFNIASTVEGSAMAANEKYLDSIEGRIGQLNATWQVFSSDLISSDVAKFFIEIANSVLKAADAMAKINVVIPLVIAGYTAISTIKAGFAVEQIADATKNMVGLQKVVTTISTGWTSGILKSGLAVSGIATAAAFAIGVYSHIKKAQEEAHQAVIDDAAEAKSKLDELNSSYSDNVERIRELDSIKGTSSWSSELESEYDALQDENVALQNQIQYWQTLYEARHKALQGQTDRDAEKTKYKFTDKEIINPVTGVAQWETYKLNAEQLYNRVIQGVNTDYEALTNLDVTSPDFLTQRERLTTHMLSLVEQIGDARETIEASLDDMSPEVREKFENLNDILDKSISKFNGYQANYAEAFASVFDRITKEKFTRAEMEGYTENNMKRNELIIQRDEAQAELDYYSKFSNIFARMQSNTLSDDIAKINAELASLPEQNSMLEVIDALNNYEGPTISEMFENLEDFQLGEINLGDYSSAMDQFNGFLENLHKYNPSEYTQDWVDNIVSIFKTSDVDSAIDTLMEKIVVGTNKEETASLIRDILRSAMEGMNSVEIADWANWAAEQDSFETVGASISQYRDQLAEAAEATESLAANIPRSYDNIASSINALVTAQQGLNGVFLEGDSITDDVYQSLVALAGSEEALDSIIDTANGNVVKNSQALRDLMSAANSSALDNLTNAESAQIQKYHELVSILDQVCGGEREFDNETNLLVNTLFESLDATQLMIDKYKLLEQQLLGTANAFTEFTNAQSIDAANDYTDDLSGMVQGFLDSYKKGEYGTETFRTAEKYLIPESVTDGIIDDAQRIAAERKYITETLGKYMTIDTSGDTPSVSIDYDNVKSFVESGLGTVFEGEITEFDLSPQITTLNDFADAMNLSETAAFALLKAIDKYSPTKESFLSKLSTEGASLETQIYAADQELAQLYKDQQELGENGKVGTQEWYDNQSAIQAAQQKRTEVGQQAAAKHEEIDSLNEKLDAAQEHYEKLLQQQKDFEDGKTDIQVSADKVEAARQNVESLQQKLYDIGSMSTVELEAELAVRTENIENIQEQISEIADIGEDGEYHLKAEFELDADKKAELDELTSQLESESNMVHEINVALGIEDEDGVEEQITAINELKIGDKIFKIQALPGNTTNILNDIKRRMQEINTTVTITITAIDNASSVISNAKSNAQSTSISKTTNVMQPKWQGTARAQGDWGTKKAINGALVGELGQELVVDGNSGTFHTVGDNGAEFVDLPRNSIVFNHKQTEELLKYGKINSRGQAMSSGNAFVHGNAFAPGLIREQVEGYVGEMNVTNNVTNNYNGSSSSASSGGSSSSSSGGGGGSSEDAADAAKEAWEKTYKKMQHDLKMHRISMADYIDWLKGAWPSAGLELEDTYQYEEEVFDGLIEVMTEARERIEGVIESTNTLIEIYNRAGDFASANQSLDEVISKYEQLIAQVEEDKAAIRTLWQESGSDMSEIEFDENYIELTNKGYEYRDALLEAQITQKDVEREQIQNRSSQLENQLQIATNAGDNEAIQEYTNQLIANNTVLHGIAAQMIELYHDAGYTDNTSEITDLLSDQFEYTFDQVEREIAVIDAQQTQLQNNRSRLENQYAEAEKRSDNAEMQRIAEEMSSISETLMQLDHQAADAYRRAGYGEDSDEVIGRSNSYFENMSQKMDGIIKPLDSIIQQSENEIQTLSDELESALLKGNFELADKITKEMNAAVDREIAAEQSKKNAYQSEGYADDTEQVSESLANIAEYERQKIENDIKVNQAEIEDLERHNDQLENQIKVTNDPNKVSELYAQRTANSKQIQELWHEINEGYRKLGYSEFSERIIEGSEAWYNERQNQIDDITDKWGIILDILDNKLTVAATDLEKITSGYNGRDILRDPMLMSGYNSDQGRAAFHPNQEAIEALEAERDQYQDVINQAIKEYNKTNKDLKDEYAAATNRGDTIEMRRIALEIEQSTTDWAGQLENVSIEVTADGLDDVNDTAAEVAENLSGIPDEIKAKYATEYEEIAKLNAQIKDLEREEQDAIAARYNPITIHYGDIAKNLQTQIEIIIAQQDAIQSERQALIDSGLGEYDSEVVELGEKWWEYEKKRINLTRDTWDEIVSYANEAVDKIQDVYETFTSAAEEFKQTGGNISIDTFQKLMSLGPQYFALLEDENGMLVINEDRINAVIEAKMRQFAADTALTYVQQLQAAANGESAETLNELLYGIEGVTDATMKLAYVQLASVNMTDEQREQAFHNLRAIESFTETAIASVGKDAENFGNDMSNLLKYIMDMMKWRVEERIKALEKEKEQYAELIDLKKKSLQQTKKETDYQKKLSDKVKEMVKIQKRIDALSLDSSREAQAERLKLIEEQEDLQEEIDDMQADHALDTQEEMLDDMQENYEKQKDTEIETLEDSISSTEKLYRMAMDYLENEIGTDYEKLKNDLLAWNYEVGNSFDVEIISAVDKAIARTEDWGTLLQAMDAYINTLVDDANKLGETVDSVTSERHESTVAPSADTTENENMSRQLSSIKDEMYENSKKWYDEIAKGTAEGNANAKQLEGKNSDLENEYEEISGKKYTRNDEGYWVDEFGQNLYGLYEGERQQWRDDAVVQLGNNMVEKSNEWKSPADTERLQAEMQGSINNLRNYFGIDLWYDSYDGKWYITKDTLHPENVGDVFYEAYGIKKYHTGGIVGDTFEPDLPGTHLKNNEVLALLEKGEGVLTAQAIENAAKFMEAAKTIESWLSGATNRIPEIPILGNLTLPWQSNYDLQPSSPTITFGDVIINGANGDTVQQHIKVNRKFMNEITGMFNLKR